VELGVDRVWISVDAATKETYEKIRVGANFDRVVENVKRFVEIKKKLASPFPEIGFRYVFTRDNYHEMQRFLELVSSFDDDCDVDFAGLLEFENTADLLHEPSDDFIRSLCEYAAKAGIELTYGHPQRETQKMMPMRNCLSWTEPYIMMGGFVVSCCSVLMSNRRPFLRANAFGNIFEKPFKDIWRSDRYRKFRRMVPKNRGEVPIFCKGCRGVNTLKRELRYGVSRTV
jgi:MoaA/NifB/PqqE/SkfB family radical SAM enzyme